MCPPFVSGFVIHQPFMPSLDPQREGPPFSLTSLYVDERPKTIERLFFMAVIHLDKSLGGLIFVPYCGR